MLPRVLSNASRTCHGHRDPSRREDRRGLLHRPRRRRGDRRDRRDRRPRHALPGRHARRHRLRRAASATRPSQDNVTIGSGAKLLGPITVGHGAKVGANSVVIHDVPPNSTVVGNPGHPVRVDGRRPEGPDTDWLHLPDPVADALKGLAERIARARAPGRRPDGHRAQAARRGPPLRRGRGPEPGRRLGRWSTMAAEDQRGAHARATRPSAPSGCSRASTRRSARRSRTAAGPLLVLAGRGLGQDARADAPRRAPRRDRPGQAVRDPRDHVHEQGRGRDARARRGARRADGAASCG